jgi:hypothetical protein
MHTKSLEQMTLATFALAAGLAFIGACVAIVHAHAQGHSSAHQFNRQLSP